MLVPADFTQSRVRKMRVFHVFVRKSAGTCGFKEDYEFFS